MLIENLVNNYAGSGITFVLTVEFSSRIPSVNSYPHKLAMQLQTQCSTCIIVGAGRHL